MIKEIILTEEERKDLMEQAKEFVKDYNGEIQRKIYDDSTITDILNSFDELKLTNPNLTYDDVWVESYEQPEPWEDYTTTMLRVYTESSSKEAIINRYEELCENLRNHKIEEYKLYLKLKEKYKGEE